MSKKGLGLGLALGALLWVLMGWGAIAGYGLFGHRGSQETSATSIVSTSLTGQTFNAPAATGTPVGTLSSLLSDNSTFSGTYTLITTCGTNCAGSSSFQIVSVTQLQTLTASLAAGPYQITVRAHQTGLVDLDTHFTITGQGTGSVIATATMLNSGGSILPVGTFISMGQLFRRGDVPSGNCVKLRNAATHTDLVKYQLDEIATRRENGDDGSIRHLVWSALTDATMAATTGTYQVEFVLTGAVCPTPAAARTLAELAAAHDLKLDLTDVRNQDETNRGNSHHLVFDINTAAGNTGRDAPRKCATGPVRDCWIISGPPIDPGNSAADPLLYVQCYVDVTSNSGGTLGPVRHICRVSNSWMNVKVGLAGNTGAPGPVGFANDPQAISYRPQLLDGSTSLLDWSQEDRSSIASTALNTSNGYWTIPNTGPGTQWQFGTAFRYTTTGTPPTGMTSGNLYYSYPPSGSDFTLQQLAQTPYVYLTFLTPAAQGTGTHGFSFRVWHTHWMSWYTTDQGALENWTNGTARAATVIYPALTTAEQTYWKQTGGVPPLRITVAPTDPTAYSNFGIGAYQPLGKTNVIGGSGVGARPDLGLVSEYSAQAFLVETPTTWARALIFSLSGDHYQIATLLNEVTGRPPVLNNGPPAGNHGGAGGSYTGLGTPWGAAVGGSGIQMLGGQPGQDLIGVAYPLEESPITGTTPHYAGGIWGGGRGYRNDHVPSFGNMIYQVFGSRHHLDALYTRGNRALYVVPQGPRIDYMDAVVAGVHYYGLNLYGSERRGSFWAHRDNMLPAHLGGDANIERTYFNDIVNENYYAQIAWEAAIDGSSTNFRNGIVPANGSGYQEATFQDAYGFQTAYQAYAMFRDPLAAHWINLFLREYIAYCSDTIVGARGPSFGEMGSYWCANYYANSNIFNTTLLTNAPVFSTNVGSDYILDASEWGHTHVDFNTNASAVVTQRGLGYVLVAGDKVKNIASNNVNGASDGYDRPDQLDPTVWYTVGGTIDNAAGTFQIINPATSTPFTAFTVHGGTALTSGFIYLKVRQDTATSSPATGAGTSYVPYAQTILYGLHNLGYSTIDPAIAVMNGRGFQDPGSTQTWLNWDPNVVVP